MKFVDQSLAQKGAVGAAAALEQQPLHAEFAVEDVQCEAEIEFGLAGEDIGHALAAQARQMRIRHRLGQHDDNRVATDVGAAPADLAVGVEHDAIGLGVAPREPGLARKALAG
jgi:hypothetical protein